MFVGKAAELIWREAGEVEILSLMKQGLFAGEIVIRFEGWVELHSISNMQEHQIRGRRFHVDTYLGNRHEANYLIKGTCFFPADDQVMQ